jgi:hypothetical protein
MEAEERYLLYFQKEGVNASACHSGRTDSLVNALYEAIERDAKFRMYLGSLKARRISVELIRNGTIKKYLNQCKQKEIEWHLFDLSTDFGIPIFLTLLISRATDKSVILTIGAKARFDSKCAILGSLEEALVIRPWVKKHIAKNLDVNETEIHTPEQRALLWTKTSSLKHLSFLLDLQGDPLLVMPNKIFSSVEEELDLIKKTFHKREIQFSSKTIREKDSKHYICFLRASKLYWHLKDEGTKKPIAFPHPFI